MADIKFSNLPVAIALDGTESVPVVQGGVTKRAAVDLIIADVLADVEALEDSMQQNLALAQAALEDAQEAAAEAVAAAASVPVVSGTLPRVTRSQLKALDTSSVTLAYLTESGREGFFKWTTGNFSTHITTDTKEGVYIKATAVAASSGAWVRIIEGRVSVKWFGAVGDNSTDDTDAIQGAINYCFGPPDNPHGRGGVTKNKVLFFPAGTYKITEPLALTGVHSGRIEGASRMSTTISNTAGGSVFVTNGFQYSHISGLLLVCTSGGSGTCFDLDYDGQGTWQVALQSNTFSDMFFADGAIGVNIGKTGFMGSENLFLNCFWKSHGTAGLKTSNFNALQQTVLGGNFQTCAIGIWVSRGSVPIIHGVGFQESGTYDIQVDNQAGDGYSVVGCRTESANFCSFGNAPRAVVSACSQTQSTSGVFVQVNAHVIIEGCYSKNGQIRAVSQNSSLAVRNSTFDRADWLHTEVDGRNYAVVFENVTTPNGVEQRSHFINAGNLLLGGMLTNWVNSGWLTNDTISRGAKGAFWQARDNTLASDNPAQGYLIENPGDDHPRVRSATAGITYLVFRKRVAISANGTQNVSMPAGTRVMRVRLNVETAPSGGTVSVGDGGSSTRFFNAQSLTSTGVTESATTEHKYSSATTMSVTVASLSGTLAGYVAIEYVMEN